MGGLRRRLVGIAVCLAFSLSLAAGFIAPESLVLTARADGVPAKTISGIGIGGISNPDAQSTSGGDWNYVYYGNDGSDPYKFRVLENGLNNQGGKESGYLLLDYDGVISGGDWGTPNGAHDWLNGDDFYRDKFTDLEKEALRNVSSGDTAQSISISEGDKLFLLKSDSVSDGNTFGYKSDASRKKRGNEDVRPWWLSDSVSDGDGTVTNYVDAQGTISSGSISTSDLWVSPAMKVNHSNILFSTQISTGNSGRKEYKLTLLDDELSLTVSGGSAGIARSGDKVTVSYTISGSNISDVDQISVLMLKKGDSYPWKYTGYALGTSFSGTVSSSDPWYRYEALTISGGNVENSNTGTFTLPASFSSDKYFVYLIAEDVNGENQTDYASEPELITIPADPNAAAETPVFKKDLPNSPSGTLVYDKYSDNRNLAIEATVSSGQLSYQWYTSTVEGKANFKTISDADESTYTIPNDENAGSHFYFCKVTNKIENGNEASADSNTIKVSINRADGKVSFTQATVNRNFGDGPFTLAADVVGNGSISYSSSNTSIATVNSSGRVVPLKAGTTVITATATGSAGSNYIYTSPNNTASYTLTINPAQITATAEGYTGTYDGKTAHGITVNVTEPRDAKIMYGTKEGTYDQSKSPTYTDAGTYTVYWQAMRDGYAAKSGSAVVTINKAESKLGTAPAAATGLTYNGAEQELVSAGTASGGDVEYAVTSGSAAPADADYSRELPKAKNAGSYRVYYRVNGGKNYKGIEAKSLNVSIAKKSVTVNGITAENKTYDGSSSATLTSVDGGYTVNATFSGVVAGDEITLSGSGAFSDANASSTVKTVTLRLNSLPGGTDSANYTIDTTASQKTTTAYINPKEMDESMAELSTEENVFTGTALVPGITVKDSTLYGSGTKTLSAEKDYTVAWFDGKGKELKAADIVGVGTYRIEISGIGNYTGTIAKEYRIVSPVSGTEVEYDGKAHGVTIASSLSGTTILYGEKEGQYTLTEAPMRTQVGTTTVYYRLTTSNGQRSEGSADITITKRTVQLAWKNTEFTYDGKKHLPEATITNLVGEEKCEVKVGLFNEYDKMAGIYGGSYRAYAEELTGRNSGNYRISENWDEYTCYYTIGKAAAKSFKTVTFTKDYSDSGFDLEINGELPADAGETWYEKGELSRTGSVQIVSWYVSESGRLYAEMTGGAVRDEITMEVSVVMQNYETSKLAVVVTLASKEVKKLTITQENGSYGVTLADPNFLPPAGTKSTKITYAGKPADGSGFVSGAEKPELVGKYTVVVECETDKEIRSSGEVGFEIKPRNIGTAEISFTEYDQRPSGYRYTGKEISPLISSVSLSWYDSYGRSSRSARLEQGIDYAISAGGSGTKVGSYVLTITGIGNYTGTCYADWSILKAEEAQVEKKTPELITKPTPANWLTYDGTAQTLLTAPAVFNSGGTVHYSIDGGRKWSKELPKAVNAGGYYIYYYCEATDEYAESSHYDNYIWVTLDPKVLNAPTVEFGRTLSFKYDGTPHRPTITVKDGSKKLTEGTDYRFLVTTNGGIDYSKGVSPGKYEAAVSGSGNYYFDSRSESFEITGSCLVGDERYGETLSLLSYPAPDPEKTTYQWLRSGETISGASESSYTLTAKDVGESVALQITANGKSSIVGPTGEIEKAQGSDDEIEIRSEDLEIGENTITVKKAFLMEHPNCSYTLYRDFYELEDYSRVDENADGKFVNLLPGKGYRLVVRAEDTETTYGKGYGYCWVTTDESRISGGFYIEGLAETYTYTGEKITPASLRVYAEGAGYDSWGDYYDSGLMKELSVGKDYTVSYSNNLNVGKATLKINGKGNYSGSTSATFRILPADLGGSGFTAEDFWLSDNGRNQKKTPVIYMNGGKKKKVPAASYTLAYYPFGDTSGKETTDFSESYTIVATAKENSSFTGERVINVHIEEDVVSLADVKIVTDKKSYQLMDYPAEDGSFAVNPKLTISYRGKTYSEGTDYLVSCNDNESPGTGRLVIIGRNELFGRRTVEFRIEGKSIAKAKVNGLETMEYRNGGVYLSDTSLELDGETLYQSYDDSEDGYKVSYLNHYKPGTATVIFTGTGNYSGTLRKTFRINKANIRLSSESGNEWDAIASLEENSVSYQAGGAKPEVSVEQSTEYGEPYTLIEGKDYQLIVKNNMKATGASVDEADRPYVQVKGMGYYTGLSGKLYFRIKPAIISDGDGSITMTQDDLVYSANKKLSFYLKTPVLKQGKNTLKKGTDYESELKYYLSGDGGKTWPVVVSANDRTKTLNNVLSGASSLADSGKLMVRAVATLKGSFSGTYSATWRIAAKSFSSVRVSITNQTYNGGTVSLWDYVYDGTIDKVIKVTHGNRTLVYGSDYEIAWHENNTKVGTAKVVLTGLGAYAGKKTAPFKIIKRAID